MNDDTLIKLASRTVVTVAAGYFVKQLFGTKAGVIGAIAVLAAHELLDAPVENYLRRAIR